MQIFAFKHLYNLRITIALSEATLIFCILIVVFALCEINDWSTSFNNHGWSKCDSTSPYIKGLYRSNALSMSQDRIHHLEKANCCKSFKNVKNDCVETNWISSFDK